MVGGRTLGSRGALGLGILLGVALGVAANALLLAGERRVAPDPSAPSRPVARIGREAISSEVLDAPLRLRLFDLEQQRYELRLRRLRDLLAERSGGSGEPVAILLEPPEPPRLEVDVDGARLRGGRDAAVTIVEFIDYQSPRSRRMQPVLRRLLERLGETLRLGVRDAPLPFHRRARSAAAAARCAAEQGRFWDYHDVLLQEQDSLERADLERYALRLDLDPERFAACLDGGPAAAAVDADLGAARALGVGFAPTFFVNGLYVASPQPMVDVAGAVRRELERLGLSVPEAQPTAGSPDPARLERSAASELPLILEGTVVASRPESSQAVVRRAGEPVARIFHIGEILAGDARLVAVDRGRAYLERGGRIEHLALGKGGRRAPAADPHRAEIVLTLERARVAEALADRSALAATLEPAPLRVDGGRLLKLVDAPPGGLWDRLGLRARDVLMLADDAWLLDSADPLWDALASRPEVTLVIMRGGRPQTFRYAIR